MHYNPFQTQNPKLTIFKFLLNLIPMKTLTLILLVFLPTVTLAQNVASEDELIALNKNIFVEYVLNGNTGPFAKAAKDDFILITGIGTVETKKQVIAGVKNLDISSLEVISDDVILFNTGAIVIGRLVMKGTVMGQPIPGKMRFSSVFVKEDGVLRLQSRTMTPVRGK